MIAAIFLALAPQAPPNAIVITLDDFGWSERPLMSSLDALAAQGTTFTRFYAQPVCSIARLALLSGSLARREGLGYLVNADPGQMTLRLDATWLPEVFNGYARSFVGKWHLGRAPESSDVTSGPYAHGFDYVDAGMINAPQTWNNQESYYDWWRVDDHAAVHTTAYMTDVQRDAFVARWNSMPEPRLAWLSWNAPHDPFLPPPGYTAQPTNRANYEQLIEYLDQALTDVLAEVDLSDTFVLVLGDNGTPESAVVPGSDPWTHKLTTREGGVRVPLIVAGPGVNVGVSSRLTSATDLAPTVVELCGLTGGDFLDGLSFADALGAWQGDPPRGWVFVETYQDGWDDQAVIEVGWKLRRVSGTILPTPPPGDYWFRILSPGIEKPLLPPPPVQSRLLAELASLPPRATP